MNNRKNIEKLSFFCPAEFCEMRLSASPTGKGDLLEGYAAIFDKFIQIGPKEYGFKEVVRAGAFKKTIQEADIIGSFNHSEDYVLARNKSGTLRLNEDSKGLHYEMDLGQQSYARDLRESIERGDVKGNSFRFRRIKELWNKERNERELLEIMLRDVGPVTFPAYDGTKLSLRSESEEHMEIDIDALWGLILRSEYGGGALPENEIEFLRCTIDKLNRYLPHDEPDKIHSVPVSARSKYKHQLELAELFI